MTESEVVQLEERARLAAQILDIPMVKDAFDTIEKLCWEEFKSTQPQDVKARERIYTTMKARAEFRQFFLSVMTEAKNARAILRQQQIKQVR